ncbi:hypothetical protein D3C81_1391390 [compost metagenome]
MRITGDDIRRVRYDQIEALCCHRAEPVTVQEIHLYLILACVACGNGQRFYTDIQRRDDCIRACMRDRDCNGTGAGTHIQYPALWWQVLQGQFHQQLGIGTRDQDCRADIKRQTIKFTFAGQVGNRFACQATGKQLR